MTELEFGECEGCGAATGVGCKPSRLCEGCATVALWAAPGDLVRMIEALGRTEHFASLEAMRRVVELDRGLSLEI